MHADKILTSGTQMFIVTMVVPRGNSCGSSLMFMWLCKSKRNRAIGRASVVPTFFGVNEPIFVWCTTCFEPDLLYPIYLC